MSDLRKRILEPLAIPVVAVVFIGGLVWGLSRFLLVTNKDMAVALAFVVSLMILVVAAFVANGRFGTAQKASLVVLGLGIAAGGSIAEATIGQREFHAFEPPADVILVALNTAFDEKEITFPAGKDELVVRVDNEDSGIAHNFALYKDEAFKEAVFVGPIFAGPADRASTFPNPGAGKYFFQCDVHPIPAMRGTATVDESAGAPAGGGAGSGGASDGGGSSGGGGHGFVLPPALLLRRRPRP